MTAPERPSSATGAGLAGLSCPAQPQELPELVTFDGPPSLTSATLEVGQLSKLCPSTGRPDQFSVQVVYTPTGGRCLEVPPGRGVRRGARRPAGRCGAQGDRRWPRRGHRAPDRPGRGRHPRHRLLPSRGLLPRPRRRSRTRGVTADAHLRWQPASSTDAKFAHHLDNDGNADHDRDADQVAVARSPATQSRLGPGDSAGIGARWPSPFRRSSSLTA